MNAEIRAWSKGLGKLSARLQRPHDGEESARIIADLHALILKGEGLARRRPDKRELVEAVRLTRTAHAWLQVAHRSRLN